ncbi:hypothetical protein [Botrimarina hoheduenensis]|uniref:Uncharacterized protein n=1 Tax=Botrimarina hoheduenensis TaxID=2528000 RepID=A0A5C5WFX3_9BACT|nr:hypothetical protein [Botrimarina hoheduenensis]TWT48995.1 hypothetical protein Pla111_07730 [Botrimarina hoheduenensis]
MSRRQCVLATLCVLLTWPAAAFAQLYPVAIGQNFTGSTFLVDSNFRTPDTMGAAGVDHFVELINGRFSVYRKSDGVRVQTSTLNQFWNNAGQTPTGGSGAFDPRVVYDPHARRWYAVAVDNGGGANNFLFAVSNSSDPTQPWTGFKIDSDADDSNWADFPMIGYNPEAVFLSANMSPLTAPQTRMSFLVLPKFGLLQSTPSIVGLQQLQDVPRPSGTNALSPQLAVDASNLLALNTSLPVLMHDFGTGELYRAEVVSPGAPSVTNVGVVGVPGLAAPPTVDQPGPKQNIEANDGRFSANTVLHNGQLYGVQSVDNGGLASVRYVRVDAATNAVLESQIIVDPASRSLTFPSIAVNEFGDVVIGVTGTSATEFASSYAMVGRTVGGLTTFDQPMLLRAGVDDYLRLDSLNRNRWGDYSSTTVDPADPSIFWTSQEYVSSVDRWSTQISELIVPLPNEARWNDAAGGLFDDPLRWQTASGGAPQPSEHLVFSRATDLSGVTNGVFFPPQPTGAYAYQSLSARQGDVELDLAGNQLDLALDVAVGPYYGQPMLTIANGSVSSVAGAIAPRPTSEGRLVLDNAHWTVDTVTVGSAPTPSAGCCLPGATGGVGTLAMVNNARLDVGGTLQVWGQATVDLTDGVLSAQTIEQFAPPTPGGFGFGLNFTGGTLQVDTFDGELINSGGTLAPGGNTIGTTDVTLGYTQLAGGVLAIDIGGTAGGQYDELNVAGTADFNGSLDIASLGGFPPSLSDTFAIVRAGFIPVVGFANLLTNTVFPTISTRLDWRLFYEPTALTLAVVPALAGDYNADGVVDAADYTVWRDTQGQAGLGLPADSNFDGVVDLIDYFAWRSNYGQVAPGPVSEAAASRAVPEPNTAVLLLIAAVGRSLRRRLGRPPRGHAERRCV